MSWVIKGRTLLNPQGSGLFTDLACDLKLRCVLWENGSLLPLPIIKKLKRKALEMHILEIWG